MKPTDIRRPSLEFNRGNGHRLVNSHYRYHGCYQQTNLIALNQLSQLLHFVYFSTINKSMPTGVRSQVPCRLLVGCKPILWSSGFLRCTVTTLTHPRTLHTCTYILWYINEVWQYTYHLILNIDWKNMLTKDDSWVGVTTRQCLHLSTEGAKKDRNVHKKYLNIIEVEVAMAVQKRYTNKVIG